MAPELELPPEIEEYRLIKPLGAGAMGQVYLAEDRLLERLVAIKFIAGAAPTAGSRQRFFTEARAAARITHANVVAVYRVAEFRRQPFLVAEYVRGRSLAELALPLEDDQVIAIAKDLARGLSAAHRRGVLHRDIKPANAMISEDGVTKLLDFGLAELLSESQPAVRSALAGTPNYMAPEMWEGEQPSVRTDIYALGVLLYELHRGVHPSETVEPMDAPLDTVIARCIEKQPLLRYPSADALLEALDGLAVIARETTDVDGSPYRGLLAFEPEHRDIFFGRRSEAIAIHERLRSERIVVIAGDSGTGKSSLCRAGVIPLLDRETNVVTVVLGRAAMLSLAAALAPVLGEPEAVVSERLIHDPAGLVRTLRANERELVVFVDQLEELVTQASRDEAAQVAEVLHVLVHSHALRLLATVRSDFLSRLAALGGLGDDLTTSLILIRPLSPERLLEAVVEPAATRGFAFESDQMVEQLIGEARVADGGLPLLQFALSELWEARDHDRKIIPLAAMDQIGGVAGALARHADGIIAALPPADRTAARAMILSLVTPDGTRARRGLNELLEVGARHSTHAASVLELLVKGRLLVAQDAEAEHGAYSIAHESLLQAWGQLAKWVDESREERRFLDELEVATALWERRGSRVEETWSHEDLSAARHRIAQLRIQLPSRLVRFLVVGEERNRERLRRRRLWWVSAAVAASLVGAVVIFAIGRYLDREHLISANVGTIDLDLQPFDLVDGNPVPVNASELPSLSWRLYAANADDPHSPDVPVPDDLVRVLSSRVDGTHLIDRMSAPGGIVFLEVTGRGRNGERCSSSWIRIQSFPGYSSAAGREIALSIPTCQATRSDALDVPAGDFIYGGPGEPASPAYGKDPDYTEPETVVSLPSFSIDRTEVSNRAYAAFSKLERTTGYATPVYSTDGLHEHDNDLDSPVSGVDAYQAHAFCRFLGKRLPSDHQWVKAARGALVVAGAVNPQPRRLYPWGGPLRPECVNRAGEGDGFAWVAPIAALQCGASPYGVLNMAGNVQEWIDRDGQTDRDRSRLYALRGGAADSPIDRDHTTTIYKNHRDPRKFDYSVGFRCIYQEEEGR